MRFVAAVRQNAGGFLGLVLLVAPAWAASPRVTFDVASSVACRDVSTPEFNKTNPHERLVEAKFGISSLVHGGQPADLLEVMIRLESPHRTAEVAEFSPKTTLASDYAGTLSYEKKDERNSSLGAGITAEFEHLFKIGGSGENGTKNGSTVKYELLPPLEQLSAAGTYGRGHGVYFKLKPSRRTSLEGAKEFQVVLRVPAEWRGDYVYLKCEAIGHRAGQAHKSAEPARWGARSFVVPLYLEGDSQARAAAAELVSAEESLRSGAAIFRKATSKRTEPDVWHQLGMAKSQPAPPTLDWLDRVVFGPPVSAGKIDATVPAEVRVAAASFTSAKRRMWQMSAAR